MFLTCPGVPELNKTMKYMASLVKLFVITQRISEYLVKDKQEEMLGN